MDKLEEIIPMYNQDNSLNGFTYPDNRKLAKKLNDAIEKINELENRIEELEREKGLR